MAMKAQTALASPIMATCGRFMAASLSKYVGVSLKTPLSRVLLVEDIHLELISATVELTILSEQDCRRIL
jgi:hypothetical protein